MIEDMFIKTNQIKLAFSTVWLMEISRIIYLKVKKLKYDGYQRGLNPVISKFFGKKSVSLADKSASSGGVKSEIMPNQQLAEEIYKLVIRKFEKRKVCSSFTDNIWGADFSDMQLICKGFRFLLCVIDIYSKYGWVIPLKEKKVLKLLILFKKFRWV